MADEYKAEADTIDREIMAKKIVEVASGGECDAARLRDAALNAVAGDNNDLALAS